MFELESRTQNYELGFHFLSSLEEAQAVKKFQEIQENITQLGGVVLSSREPKKQHLSYPVDHQRYALFGTVNFKSPAEVISQLESQLKLNDSILRFLVLKVRENARVLKSLRDISARPKTKTYTPPKPEEKKAEVKPEVMEKQIEEVIENI